MIKFNLLTIFCLIFIFVHVASTKDENETGDDNKIINNPKICKKKLIKVKKRIFI